MAGRWKAILPCAIFRRAALPPFTAPGIFTVLTAPGSICFAAGCRAAVTSRITSPRWKPSTACRKKSAGQLLTWTVPYLSQRFDKLIKDKHHDEPRYVFGQPDGQRHQGIARVL